MEKKLFSCICIKINTESVSTRVVDPGQPGQYEKKKYPTLKKSRIWIRPSKKIGSGSYLMKFSELFSFNIKVIIININIEVSLWTINTFLKSQIFDGY